MGINLAEAIITISANMGPVTSALDVLKSKIVGLTGPGMTGLIQNSGLGWMLGLGSAGVAAGAFVYKSVQAAREMEGTLKRLDFLYTSTGGTVGRTTAQMQTFAGELAKTAGIDDDAILTAQERLMQFREIRGKMFDETITAATNLSRIKGGNPADYVSQLAMAMQNPEMGARILRRMGVGWGELAGIKAAGKESPEAGQKAIIDALNKTYGGAAAAMKSPFGEFEAALDNLQKAFGSELLPTIKDVTVALTEWMTGLKSGEATPAQSAAAQAIAQGMTPAQALATGEAKVREGGISTLEKLWSAIEESTKARIDLLSGKITYTGDVWDKGADEKLLDQRVLAFRKQFMRGFTPAQIAQSFPGSAEAGAAKTPSGPQASQTGLAFVEKWQDAASKFGTETEQAIRELKELDRTLQVLPEQYKAALGNIYAVEARKRADENWKVAEGIKRSVDPFENALLDARSAIYSWTSDFITAEQFYRQQATVFEKFQAAVGGSAEEMERLRNAWGQEKYAKVEEVAKQERARKERAETYAGLPGLALQNPLKAYTEQMYKLEQQRLMHGDEMGLVLQGQAAEEAYRKKMIDLGWKEKDIPKVQMEGLAGEGQAWFQRKAAQAGYTPPELERPKAGFVGIAEFAKQMQVGVLDKEAEAQLKAGMKALVNMYTDGVKIKRDPGATGPESVFYKGSLGN